MPIGLNPHDRVPCGHAWKLAMVEYWMIFIQAHTERMRSGRISAMDIQFKSALVTMLGVLLGGVERVQWPLLVTARALGAEVRRRARLRHAGWPAGSQG